MLAAELKQLQRGNVGFVWCFCDFRFVPFLEQNTVHRFFASNAEVVQVLVEVVVVVVLNMHRPRRCDAEANPHTCATETRIAMGLAVSESVPGGLGNVGASGGIRAHRVH